MRMLERFNQLEPERQRYTLETLPFHLNQARKIEALYSLIDRPWMELKLEHTYSHRSFVQDVELAIEAARAEQPVNWGQEIRCSLIQATLGALATQVPLSVLIAMTKMGRVSMARGYAALIQDSEKQCHTYLRMATILQDRGDFGVAREVLRDALAATATIENEDEKAALLVAVSKSMMGVGELDRALQAAETITKPWYRMRAFGRLVHAFAQRDDQARARDLAQEVCTAANLVPDERTITMRSYLGSSTIKLEETEYGFAHPHTDAQWETALACTRASKYQEALNAVLALNHIFPELSHWSRARILADVAAIIYQSGLSEKVEKVIQQAMDEVEMIGTPQPDEEAPWPDDIGESDQMRETLCYLDALGYLAWTLAQFDATERVVQMSDWALAKIEESEDYQIELESGASLTRLSMAQCLLTNVQALTRVNEIDRAFTTANAIRDRRTWGTALAHLAHQLTELDAKDLADQARAGVIEEFSLAASQIDRGEGAKDQAGVLCEFARMLAQVDGVDEAAETAEKARMAASKITLKEDRASMLGEVAQIFAELGMDERAAEIANYARATAESVKANLPKVSMLSSLAQALCHTGQLSQAAQIAEKALEIAHKVTGKQRQVGALEIATPALVRAGLTQSATSAARNAEATASELKSDRIRAIVFTQAANALASAGMAKEAKVATRKAIRAAGKGKRVSDRALRLSEAALALTRAGDTKAAAKTAEKAVRTAARISRPDKVAVLCHSAEVMAKVGKLARAKELIDTAQSKTRRISDPADRVESLSRVCRALVQLGDPNQASELTEQILVDIENLPTAERRAEMLGQVCEVLIQAGKRAEALVVLQRGLEAARSASRVSVFSVVAAGAPALATEDQGHTVQKVFETVTDVENWW